MQRHDELLDAAKVMRGLQERTKADTLREAIERGIKASVAQHLNQPVTKVTVDSIRQTCNEVVANVSYELPATVESMCLTIDVGPGVKL